MLVHEATKQGGSECQTKWGTFAYAFWAWSRVSLIQFSSLCQPVCFSRLYEELKEPKRPSCSLPHFRCRAMLGRTPSVDYPSMVICMYYKEGVTKRQDSNNSWRFSRALFEIKSIINKTNEKKIQTNNTNWTQQNKTKTKLNSLETIYIFTGEVKQVYIRAADVCQTRLRHRSGNSRGKNSLWWGWGNTCCRCRERLQ